MADNESLPAVISAAVGEVTPELRGTKYGKCGRFAVAALSVIPWVGGVIGASAALHAEAEQSKLNELIQQWLEQHHHKINELVATLDDIVSRVDQLGAEPQQRLNQDDYLALVRQGFRIWDGSNTDSKRGYVRRTLTNAASTSICSDDLVRLFLEWIERYDETHFRVIRVLFRNKGATRGRIWEEIGNGPVREDSAEADLFKLLIFDLSTGHVLRQMRQTNEYGEFLAKPRTGRSVGRSGTLESAFEDTKPYELTTMGEQFATYVLNETVPRIA